MFEVVTVVTTDYTKDTTKDLFLLNNSQNIRACFIEVQKRTN